MRRRVGLRSLVVGIIAAVLAAGCSDAHTTEEKAWADDGTGPDIMTIYSSPAFELGAKALARAYQNTELSSRVVVVVASADHIAAAIDDVHAPSVWIAPSTTFDDREPDERTVDMGESPLVIAYPRDGRTPPTLGLFAEQGNGTGMCVEEEPCGGLGRQLLANEGLAADPDVLGAPASLVDQIAGGTLESALVFATDANMRWLQVVNDHKATDDPDLTQPWAARPFGDDGVTGDFLDWLATSEQARRIAHERGVSIPPDDPAEGS